MMLTMAVLTLVQIVSNNKVTDLCQKSVFAVSGDRQLISHAPVNSTFSKRDITFCKYDIHTKPGNLIRVELQYSFIVPKEHKNDPDCSEKYIHIGNDRMRVGVEMLTSYKLCRSTLDEEIVSRGNYLWVIVPNLEPAVFSWLHIHYQAKLPVSCNSTMFRCSPVQCVPQTSVCDGLADCDNARDEYCATRLGEVMTPSHKLQEPCFLCGDGTCISPTLPRYSLDWGKQLWYLCDGYSHCHDGTDERKDVCYRLKGRSTALFSCVPISLNLTASLWDNVLCDGREDCVGGSDESAQLCDKHKKASQALDPMSVIIPIAAILMLALGVVIWRALYNTQMRRIALPTTCLDTTSGFAELGNSLPAAKWERTRSSRETFPVEEDMAATDQHGVEGDLYFRKIDDGYIDDHIDIPEDSSADEETTFDVSAIMMQTSV